MSTILVTGASGFIGSHLCKRLTAEGHKVHGISRVARPSGEDGIQWWPGDLGNYDTVHSLLDNIRPDISFHLASRVTGSRELGEVVPIFQANLASTVNLLTSTVETGCERVVIAGSLEEPTEIDFAIPCSPYAAAKWSSTAYAAMFRSLFGLSVVAPRIFMTYGPGQIDTTKLIPYAIISMLRGERPKLSSGIRLVDWVFIEDVVEGLIRAAFTPNLQEVSFDLGSGSLTSIRAIVEQIAQIIGNGAEPAFGVLPDRPMERERAANVEMMERTLHWKPRKALRDGLEETIAWYKRELGNRPISIPLQ